MQTTVKLAKRKNAFGEYAVRVYVDGKLNKDATYYTADWQDARDTANQMARQLGITTVWIQTGNCLRPHAVV